MQCTGNCKATNPKNRRHFEQPVIQTLQMLMGEMGCWLVVGAHSLYRRIQERRGKQAGYFSIPSSAPDPLLVNNEEPEDDDDDAYSDDPLATSLTLTHDGRATLGGWKVTYLALPAICDIIGTTLMNVGLLFVAASIYQMTRGALVLFVGLFSVWFLKRRLGLYKWFALFVVVSGVAVVGLAGAIAKDKKATPSSLLVMQHYLNQPVSEMAEVAVPEMSVALKTVIGISMIAGAQIFTATQFVVEERIMEKYSIEPLKAVGWEGIWGFLVTMIGMVVLHFAYGNTAAGKGGYFDMNQGLWEVTHFRAIAVSSVLIMISIGRVFPDPDLSTTANVCHNSGFNFFGLSVTRSVSATARSTIDTCRTLFIWVVSLGLGWETFKWLQVVGFAMLVYGTFVFNDIVQPPLKMCIERDESDDLLPEHPVEHN